MKAFIGQLYYTNITLIRHSFPTSKVILTHFVRKCIEHLTTIFQCPVASCVRDWANQSSSGRCLNIKLGISSNLIAYFTKSLLPLL